MTPTPSPEAMTSSRGTNAYLLALLTFASTISFVDRYMLAALVQPVKADLGLSDTQIGLLTGFAFSAIYALFGLPMARLADRGQHRHVIIGSLAVWSAMTALCGAAGSFVTLAMARFGVGAGEAGALPASQALLAQRFPPHRRNLALAVLGCSGPVGLLIAFLSGAMLEAHLGWRLTFVAVSVPGAILALVFWLTIAEPGKVVAPTTGRPRLNAMGVLLRNPAFRNIALAQAGLALLMFGQAQWLPAFFERSFALPRIQVGPMLALTNGLAAILGMVVGGVAADRLAARNPQWPIRIALGSLCLAIPAVLALYLTTSPGWGFAYAALMGFCLSAPGGPLFALVQGLVPNEYRATAAATSALCAAFIGLGAGPLIIGVVSDSLTPSLGAQSLRYALLLTVGVVLPWCLFHFFRVGRLQSLGFSLS